MYVYFHPCNRVDAEEAYRARAMYEDYELIESDLVPPRYIYILSDRIVGIEPEDGAV